MTELKRDVIGKSIDMSRSGVENVIIINLLNPEKICVGFLVFAINNSHCGIEYLIRAIQHAYVSCFNICSIK